MNVSYRSCLEQDLAKVRISNPVVSMKVEALLDQFDRMRECMRSLEDRVTHMAGAPHGSVRYLDARRVELPCLGALEGEVVAVTASILKLGFEWQRVGDSEARAAVEAVAKCLTGTFEAIEELVRELKDSGGQACSEDTLH